VLRVVKSTIERAIKKLDGSMAMVFAYPEK